MKHSYLPTHRMMDYRATQMTVTAGIFLWVGFSVMACTPNANPPPPSPPATTPPPATETNPVGFRSLPPRIANVGKPMRYRAQLNRSGQANWDIVAGPTGASIGEDGLLLWTPNTTDEGTLVEFTLQAALHDEITTQSFRVGVPKITIEAQGLIEPALGLSTLRVDSPMSPIQGTTLVISTQAVAGVLEGEEPVGSTYSIGSVEQAQAPFTSSVAANPVVEFGPSQVFAAPVRLMIPIRESEIEKIEAGQTLMAYAYHDETWESLYVRPESAASGFAAVQTAHFSNFTSVAVPTAVENLQVRKGNSQCLGSYSMALDGTLSLNELPAHVAVNFDETRHTAGTLLELIQDGLVEAVVVEYDVDLTNQAERIVGSTRLRLYAQKQSTDVYVKLLDANDRVLCDGPHSDCEDLTRARLLLFPAPNGNEVPLAQGTISVKVVFVSRGVLEPLGGTPFFRKEYPLPTPLDTETNDNDCDGIVNDVDLTPDGIAPPRLTLLSPGSIRTRLNEPVTLEVLAEDSAGPMAVQWQVPNEVRLVANDELNSNITVGSDVQGTYELRAIAENDGGRAAVRTWLHVVEPIPMNTPPRCHLSLDSSQVYVNDTVSIRAFLEDAESLPTELANRWSHLGVADFAAIDPIHAQVIPRAAGELVVSCTPSDGELVGEPSSITIRVAERPANIPPTLHYVSPTSSTLTLRPGEMAEQEILAAYEDADGIESARVEFELVHGPGELVIASEDDLVPGISRVRFRSNRTGQAVIFAHAVDDNGAQSEFIRLYVFVVQELSAQDEDEDGFPQDIDCDDRDAAVHPGAREQCNGRDDDCNDVTDDGFGIGERCVIGVGICQREGERICHEGGLRAVCNVQPGAPSLEICDGLDNDCDETVDNVDEDQLSDPNNCGACGNVCTTQGNQVALCVGTEDSSYACQSQCASGFVDLDQDALNGCEYECTVSNGGVEICDGQDNDCDGEIDEELERSDYTGPPGTAGVGACRAGRTVCVLGEWVVDSTLPMVLPADESCDGTDNDCNGQLDDDGASGCTIYYEDADADGFGNLSNTVCACELRMGYSTDSSDCDDQNPENYLAWRIYEDEDRDGMGSGSRVVVCAGVSFPDGYADIDGDNCPTDAEKFEEGVCGCGVGDADGDSDGSADCVDGCPTDANKTEAGVCGCGVEDADSDRDSVADCEDDCPTDSAKIEPGTCGCGEAELPDCGAGCACSDQSICGAPECEDVDGNTCTGFTTACVASCRVGGDASCPNETFCDTLAAIPVCVPLADQFWTQHKLPSEFVGGQRRQFFVSNAGDDLNGNGSIALPFRTINRAYREARLQAGAYTGFYDNNATAERKQLSEIPSLHAAIFLKRGDIFDARDELAYLEANGGRFDSDLSGGKIVVPMEISGESAENRFLFLSYGAGGVDDYSGRRPILRLTTTPEKNPLGIMAGFAPVVAYYSPTPVGDFCPSPADFEDCLQNVRHLKHITIAGIEIDPGPPTDGAYPIFHRNHLSASTAGIRVRAGLIEDMLMEDMYIHHVGVGVAISHDYRRAYQQYASGEDLRLLHKNIRMRRCIFSETYSGKPGQSVSGAIAARYLTDLFLEECIIDESCNAPDLDIVAAYDPATHGGLSLYPLDFDAKYSESIDSDGNGTIESSEKDYSFGAFTLGAAPHSIYVRHESGGEFRVLGNITIRGGTQNDKWNNGVKLSSSVFVDNGLYSGSPLDTIGTSNQGPLADSVVVDSAFIGVSPNFGGTAVSVLGPVSRFDYRRNFVGRRDDGFRPAFAIENRTTSDLEISLSSAGFVVGGNTFPATVNLAQLCNQINHHPDGAARCILRASPKLNVLSSIAPFDAEVIPPGDQRRVVYRKPLRGDAYFGAVQLDTKYVLLEVAGLDLSTAYPFFETPTQRPSIRVFQPATGAYGWVIAEGFLAVGELTYVSVAQTGDALDSNPFVAYQDALIWELDGVETELGTLENTFSLGQIHVSDNSFDVFGMSDTIPKGHVLRVASTNSAVSFDRNKIFAINSFVGAENNLGQRIDVLALNSFTLGNTLKSTFFDYFAAASSQKVAFLKQRWTDTQNGLSPYDILPFGLSMNGNKVRFNGVDSLMVGINIADDATQTLHFYDSSHFETIDQFCSRKAMFCESNQLISEDVEGLPTLQDVEQATFAGYRTTRALPLAPARYIGMKPSDEEIETMRQHLLSKHRGNWSEYYDVYSLLQYFREKAKLPSLRRPYLQSTFNAAE